MILIRYIAKSVVSCGEQCPSGPTPSCVCSDRELQSHVRRRERLDRPRVEGRGLHSSTSQLNLSRF